MTTIKKFLALALALLMMVSAGVGVVATSAAEAESAYDDAINYLAALGVLKGYDDGETHADENVQRYQMALFFVRVMTGTVDDSAWAGTSTFDDVKQYAGAIGYVQGLGVINGVGDNKFAPNDGIRYQDAIVMAIRALGYETENMSYPYGYISKAIQLGLTANIKGVAYGDTLTRGVTAQIIYNVLNTPIYSQGGFVVDGLGNVKFDKDSTTFLGMNFNTETTTAVLEGTNNVGNVVEKTGYVKFDGGLKIAKESVVNYGTLGSIDEAVGYSFSVVYNKSTKEVLAATICDMISFENIGASAEFAPVYGKNNNVKDTTLFTAGDETYKLLGASETDVDTDNYDGIKLYNAATDALITDVTDLYFDKGASSAADKTLFYNYGKIVLVENDAKSEGYDVGYFYQYSFDHIVFIEARDAKNNNNVTEFVAFYNFFDGKYYFLTENSGMQTVDVATYFGMSIDKVLASKPTDLKIVGANELTLSRDLDVRGTVNSGDFVIGYYNYDHNYYEVASVASIKSGRLTAKSNSTVTIGGTRYNFGFLGDIAGVDATAYANGYAIASVATNNMSSSMLSNTSISSFINDRIAALANLESTEANVNYVVMNGRVVWLQAASKTVVSNNVDNKFVLVDLEMAENKKEGAIALDKNNNITLWAVTENGGKEQIKISAIYDSKVSGSFVAAKDLKNSNAYFTSAAVQTSWGEKQFKSYKNSGNIYGESELVTFLKGVFGGKNVKMFTVIELANGAYVLDVNADYEVANSGVKAIQSVSATAYAKAEFRNGTLSKLNSNTNMVDFGISASRLVFDTDATIVLFDENKIVVTGVPENGAWINTTGATVYAASSDLLVLGYDNVVEGTTYNWKKTTTGLQASGDLVYVAITGSNYDGVEFGGTVENNGTTTTLYNHTYSKLLNLATMTVESKTFTTTSATALLNATAGNVNVVKVDDDGYASVVSAGSAAANYYAVAKALGYNFGTLTAIGDAYEIAINGDSYYEDRAGVTNATYTFTNGSSINSYSVFAIYKNANGQTVTTTITDATNNTIALTGKACLYKYNATADHMDVIVFAY